MNRKNGFTLVEILIVIAILGLLVSILIGAVQRSKTAQASQQEVVGQQTSKEELSDSPAPKESW